MVHRSLRVTIINGLVYIVKYLGLKTDPCGMPKRHNHRFRQFPLTVSLPPITYKMALELLFLTNNLSRKNISVDTYQDSKITFVIKLVPLMNSPCPLSSKVDIRRKCVKCNACIKAFRTLRFITN